MIHIDTVLSGPLEVNSYIIYADGSKDCVVTDPGGARPILRYLREKDLTARAILITHGHFDHILGLEELRRETGATVFVHEADRDKCRTNRGSLSFMIGKQLTPCETVTVIRNGDALSAAGLTFRVLHTPGHCEGAVCYVLDEANAIFCGDTLFCGSYGRTDFPGCSLETLYRSVTEKLFTLEGDYTLYPGHGPVTTLSEERLYNPILQDWTAEV